MNMEICTKHKMKYYLISIFVDDCSFTLVVQVITHQKGTKYIANLQCIIVDC